jgi:hypothetical protein
MEVLFTFETVSAALDCEQLFRELDIPCRIIPAPRTLSASCAYAIRAETADLSGLCETLRRKGAEYGKIFRAKSLPGQGEAYEFLAGPGGRKTGNESEEG